MTSLADSQAIAAKGFWRDAFWCSFYGSGIIGTLVVYGLLQEKIMDHSYGGAMFEWSAFLVLWNRFFAVLFAIIMATIMRESFTPGAPWWKFLAVSLSNVFASMCQYEALKYVSFPVQMLGKSFKMMPVMCWGIAISGKRYGLTEWLVALSVTGGVTEFLMTGPVSSSSDQGNSVKGFLLLLSFLLLDGFTSTFQEKLFREHQTTKYNQMLYVNLASSVISTFGLLASGRITSAFGFAMAHPTFVGDALSLSSAAVLSQWFIYSQVKEFGALIFAATMNVRQVVSILISYAKYGHSITALQILGLVFIFAALFYKSFVDLFKPAEEKKSLIEKTPEVEAPPAAQA